VILDVIGTPDEENLSFISDEKALEYLASFEKKDKADFSKRFPAANPLALDFLTITLAFNPFLRPTVDELLDHPYLIKVKHYLSLT